jgi:dienelactone hydrolase
MDHPTMSQLNCRDQFFHRSWNTHFREEMHAAKVDHEVIIFEDAKHGFSNPLADERAKANGVDLGYNLEAERQGLDAMYDLLERNLSA